MRDVLPPDSVSEHQLWKLADDNQANFLCLRLVEILDLMDTIADDPERLWQPNGTTVPSNRILVTFFLISTVRHTQTMQLASFKVRTIENDV